MCLRRHLVLLHFPYFQQFIQNLFYIFHLFCLSKYFLRILFITLECILIPHFIILLIQVFSLFLLFNLLGDFLILFIMSESVLYLDDFIYTFGFYFIHFCPNCYYFLPSTTFGFHLFLFFQKVKVYLQVFVFVIFLFNVSPYSYKRASSIASAVCQRCC